MAEANQKDPSGCNDPINTPKALKTTRRTGVDGGFWQAPQGVAPGTWDYISRDHIGDHYDAFVGDEPLNIVDRKIISRYLPPLNAESDPTLAPSQTCAPLVVDFGSGTGRTLLPLVGDGYRGLAVDLSESMLKNLREKMLTEFGPNAPVTSIQANLVNLGAIADNSADHGVCMLSTLGMIKKSTNRAIFLKHVRRIVRPNGLFFVHAHNYFYQWRHPGGIKWAAANAWASLRRKAEIGDREATYRQVSGMFIHQFRRRELARALRDAGFTEQEWHGVEAGSTQPVLLKRASNPFRFVGWVVVGKP